jgi:hypothetical protein
MGWEGVYSQREVFFLKSRYVKKMRRYVSLGFLVSAYARKLISDSVIQVTCSMSSAPYGGYKVHLHILVHLLPQLDILDRTSVGLLPTVSMPAANPLVDPVNQVL